MSERVSKYGNPTQNIKRYGKKNQKQAGIEPATSKNNNRIINYSVVASAVPGVVHMDHVLDVQAVSNCHIRTATLNVVLTQNRFGFCVGLPYLESSAAADTKCCVDTKSLCHFWKI